MVASHVGDGVRNATSSATVQQSTGFTVGRATPIAELRSAPASRMEIIRQGFRGRGFSSSLVDLLVAGSRTSTLSTYESAWRNWAAWCLQRGENPLSTSLNFVLEFLAELHASGKSYSTINVHRSMISKTLPLVEGKPIGSHPLIKSILNGCYNLNPPKPKYNSSWDPNVAITFITSLGDNRLLRLTTLSRKTVVLLALASLLRVSELTAINLQSIAFSNNGLNFSLLKPRKAQHSGPLQSFFIPSLQDPGSCPVEAVRSYIDVTAPYRNNSNNTNLFVSCIKPHRVVTSNTVSGWIRSLLTDAGIDTTIFSAHSTRGAAASKAFNVGMSMDAILKAGHWARESTFSKFYKRNQVASVAETVLGLVPPVLRTT